MAGSSLLALIDDIASILDDVATMTKVAAKKTAGVLGDDLALNAQQVAGVRAERELPVVWAVAKGSLRNKAILVPAALLISAVAEWAITPLLMLGGLYLCYEGFEKLAHRYIPSHDTHVVPNPEQAGTEETGREFSEKEKIQGAIRTDFILSAEIIVITLGSVAEASFWQQVAVLTGIAIIMTVGVYGLVAGIVKLDDFGLYLDSRPGEGRLSALRRWFGRSLLQMAPWLMKTLSVVGTIAMFMVGGSILMHGIPPAHHLIGDLQSWIASIPAIGEVLAAVVPLFLEILLGIVAGALVLFAVLGFNRLRGLRVF